MHHKSPNAYKRKNEHLSRLIIIFTGFVLAFLTWDRAIHIFDPDYPFYEVKKYFFIHDEWYHKLGRYFLVFLGILIGGYYIVRALRDYDEHYYNAENVSKFYQTYLMNLFWLVLIFYVGSSIARWMVEDDVSVYIVYPIYLLITFAMVWGNSKVETET